jgi:RND family efflux transporter MFP subunit
MIKKLIGPLIIVAAIVAVTVLIKNKPRPETKNVESKDVISLLVAKTSPAQHPLIIPAEGFVSSRWQTTLSSQVAGQVVEVSNKLLVGNQFAQGDVLLKIDPLDYQVKLARAQANLESAESNLVEQEKQSERAKSDWYKLNPDREPSDFNLRLPQLRSAQSNLQAAKSELRLAQENLSRTQIKAPFDGFSISRSVNLGEQLQIGSVVAEIIDRKNLELKVSLTLSQAALIEQAEKNQFQLDGPASETLSDIDNNLKVSNVRFEPFIESQNRWRSLILELDNNSNGPLLGEFLKISIMANQAKEMLALPESAMSIDGRIWYVDADNKAQFFTPEIIYKNSGTLYLVVNNELSYPLDVVISPPNSILRGTEVITDSWRSSGVAE